MRVWVLAGMLFSYHVHAKILPDNDLHLQDGIFQSNISETQFHAIIDSARKHYAPLVAALGGTLNFDRDWKSSKVNASAERSGDNWKVTMFGGLARRPEITPDGFALVVCHELGHHLAGYPFKGSRWASTEGESDYFATQTCARLIWSSEKDENQKARETVNDYAENACNKSWSDVGEQDLCYRVANASLSLAKLLAALRAGTETPKFDTPDPSVVSKTNENHPKAQCRLDTYFQGGLCVVSGPISVIPGRDLGSRQNSPEAEEDALRYSCGLGASQGIRPSCWFKSKLAL